MSQGEGQIEEGRVAPAEDSEGEAVAQDMPPVRLAFMPMSGTFTRDVYAGSDCVVIDMRGFALAHDNESSSEVAIALILLRDGAPEFAADLLATYMKPLPEATADAP